MANGSGGIAANYLAEQASKNGPFAVGCVILLYGFYLFALRPMASERQMLLETLQGNVAHGRETMDTIAENTTAVTRSIALQQTAIEKITKAQEERTRVAAETQKKMFAFADEMIHTHPEQARVLAEILKELKAQDDS